MDWGRAKSGGKNFRTHKLVIEGPVVAEFKTTMSYFLVGLDLIIIGIAICFGMIANSSNEMMTGSLTRLIFPILFGFIFVVSGSGGLIASLSPIEFDKRSGDFKKGRKAISITTQPHSDLELG